jgi:hypothetical protein
MRNKLILAASLTLALASTSAALAQTDRYDLTGGDHMYSYGAAQPSTAPTRIRAVRHTEEDHPTSVPSQTQWQSNPQYDRTGDHMYSFGPGSK